MWLIFDTVADCAKFFASAYEFGGKDPQKGVAGSIDGVKKITLDIQALTNPPDPITVNVAFGDDQATPATSGDAWAQVWEMGVDRGGEISEWVHHLTGCPQTPPAWAFVGVRHVVLGAAQQAM